MTAAEFIQSGIIETYCLGFTSVEENKLVEKMSAAFPEVKEEIEKVQLSFREIIRDRKIQPPPSVKTAVMTTIYTHQAATLKEWVPLMNQATNFSRFHEAALANGLTEPAIPYDDIFVQELPSTREVINLAVWAKTGHDEEVHYDMEEYIAVLEGSCHMLMNGQVLPYTKGDIIILKPGIPHKAVVTSEKPMFALVQRQMLQGSTS